MNYNERRTYQRNWHRLLRLYEKKYLPKILKALEAEADRFIKEAEQVGFQSAFRTFGLVNPQLLKVIEQMHKEVGLKFGKDVNRYLTRTQKISFFNANFLLNLVEILTRQALELLTAVETTTKERILQILNRSTVEQLSFVDTARLITEQVASPERALTITRTESNRAANIAAFEAARLQDYEVTKEWISSIDSRTRRYREKDEYDHAILDGTVQELDQAFQQTGRTKGIIANAQYPLDAQAPAAFTINCRCVLGFENKRDANGNLIPKKRPIRPIEINKLPIEIPTLPKQEGFVEGNTLEETSANLKKYIQEISKLKIKSVKAGKSNLDPELSVDDYNKKAKQVARLFEEYNILSNVSKEEGSEINVEFNSGGRFYGRVVHYVIPGTKNRRIEEINFGHKGDTTSRLFVDKSQFLRYKSAVDPENLILATPTHEFAHILTIQEDLETNDGNVVKDFWKEIKKIKKQYVKERNAEYLKVNLENLNDFYLGQYADTNLNEFMAEAFTEYKLRKTPSKYAKQVGELIDKYFKK